MASAFHGMISSKILTPSKIGLLPFLLAVGAPVVLDLVTLEAFLNFLLTSLFFLLYLGSCLKKSGKWDFIVTWVKNHHQKPHRHKDLSFDFLVYLFCFPRDLLLPQCPHRRRLSWHHQHQCPQVLDHDYTTWILHISYYSKSFSCLSD